MDGRAGHSARGELLVEIYMGLAKAHILLPHCLQRLPGTDMNHRIRDRMERIALQLQTPRELNIFANGSLLLEATDSLERLARERHKRAAGKGKKIQIPSHGPIAGITTPGFALVKCFDFYRTGDKIVLLQCLSQCD